MKFKKIFFLIIIALVITSCESGFEDMIDEAKTGEADVLSVSYNKNCGGTLQGILPVDENEYIINETVTVKSGISLLNINDGGKSYYFKEWNTKQGGGGITYVSGATFQFTGKVTLYAQWQEYAIGDTGPLGGTVYAVSYSYTTDGYGYIEAYASDIFKGTYTDRVIACPSGWSLPSISDYVYMSNIAATDSSFLNTASYVDNATSYSNGGAGITVKPVYIAGGSGSVNQWFYCRPVHRF